MKLWSLVSGAWGAGVLLARRVTGDVHLAEAAHPQVERLCVIVTRDLDTGTDVFSISPLIPSTVWSCRQ